MSYKSVPRVSYKSDPQECALPADVSLCLAGLGQLPKGVLSRKKVEDTLLDMLLALDTAEEMKEHRDQDAKPKKEDDIDSGLVLTEVLSEHAREDGNEKGPDFCHPTGP